MIPMMSSFKNSNLKLTFKDKDERILINKEFTSPKDSVEKI